MIIYSIIAYIFLPWQWALPLTLSLLPAPVVAHEMWRLFRLAKAEYDEYMAMGLDSDRPHITVGAGLRFIMNQNFIVCFEYGKPVGKYSKQDGNGAFYINTGFLFSRGLYDLYYNNRVAQ